jgi:hypothetical protein
VSQHHTEDGDGYGEKPEQGYHQAQEQILRPAVE